VYITSAAEEQWLPLLAHKGPELLATLFNVSAVRLKERPPAGTGILYESPEIPGLLLEVVPGGSLGWRKCERCWMWSPRVGEDPGHPGLCERCVPVVRSIA
jgi:isoleucyl-tRNA synthetase